MSGTTTRKPRQPSRKPKPHPTTAPPSVATLADGYVSRRMAAQLLGVNTQTIDAQIKAARDPLPAYRFGRRVLIKRAELLARVERRRV